MKINNINNPSQHKTNHPNFKGTDTIYKVADLFLKSQENLSSTRFIQDTATNWLPKAIFSRSKADLAEMSFLEFCESAIFYFASPFLGEKLFRNRLFKQIQPKNVAKEVISQVPNGVEDIAKNKNLTNEIKNRAITTKAGIVLACIAIPVAEYTLSFAKNLFTLKVFKKSNFDNIANLDKNSTNKTSKEDKNQQERVERNAKKQLVKAGIISSLGLLSGLALAKYGIKSDKLINLSKNILEPGKAIQRVLNNFGEIGKKAGEKVQNLSFDFKNENGKLALSKGQLGLTALIGLFGYSKAAKDRGKLDFLEVWSRVPLVVFYTIFGSELFEAGFTKILKNNPKFDDILRKDKFGKVNVPLRAELPELATKIAKNNGTNEKEELKRLTKQKAFISAVPYLFSFVAMGLTLSAITRFWTQYRYNHQNNENKLVEKNNVFNQKLPDLYKDFQKYYK